MPNVISFAEAVADSEQYSKRHLMLGNGFSIGCRSDIFHYASLFEEADFSGIPGVQRVFGALKTQDFEVAIHALESAVKIVPIYAPENVSCMTTMLGHSAALKEVLVATIANNHPSNPNEIEDAEFWACRKFLRHFLAGNRAGHVFTLNYDLLLYWALMHDDNPLDGAAVELKKNDSFGNDEDDPEAEYVVWQGETAAHQANIHFLHGALHLFDAGSELQKYTWVRNGKRLVDQARAAIEDNKFPLFVAEGTSLKKKNKIRHNAYLYQCFKVLTANADTRNHCFFIFGHSLAENDEHILKRLGRGRFRKLYIGLFGPPDSPGNTQIIARAASLSGLRQEQQTLEIAFFDSCSAEVWGAE